MNPRVHPGSMLAGVLVACLSYVGLCRAQEPCVYSQHVSPDGPPFTLESPGFPSSNYAAGFVCDWKMFTLSSARMSVKCAGIIPEIDLLFISDTVHPTEGTKYSGNIKVHRNSKLPSLSIHIVAHPLSEGGKFRCTVKADNVPAKQALPRQADCSCGYSNKVKIVGGLETSINEFPFMAGLVSNSMKILFCGATILTSSFFLTAAHCIQGRELSDLAVVVGEHNVKTGQETDATLLSRVDQYWIHPQYDSNLLIHDLSVVKIRDSLDFYDKIGPVCLPFNNPETHVGRTVDIAGWGLLESSGYKAEVLQKATIQVVPIEECQALFGTKVHTEGRLCTFGGYRDSCQFDSGGPVLLQDPGSTRYRIVGVISYGKGCGLNYSSVNTRVYPYLGWIESLISGDPYCVVD